jgi:hypothetical protein
VIHWRDSSEEILRILDDVEGKLGAFGAWKSLTQQTGAEFDILGKVPQLMEGLRRLMEAGKLGYWLFVAKKPG